MMMTRILLPLAFVIPFTLQAQDRYVTRDGHVSFHSETPMEKIEAHNHKVTSVMDLTTLAVEITMLVKAFEFEKALMQEHFNENYMESDKFPKATFKGKIGGATAEQLSKPGDHKVTVEGDLTIHGVTKPVKVEGTMSRKDAGSVRSSATFIVKPEDHGITIPGMVRDNIAKEITVKVDLPYSKM